MTKIRLGFLFLLIGIYSYAYAYHGVERSGDITEQVSSYHAYHGVEYNGDITEQVSYYRLKKDFLLNPNLELGLLPKWENLLSANLGLNISYKEWLKITIKDRPLWSIKDKDENSCKNFLDEAYIDLKLFKTSFLTIGKENLQEGVGLSYNPSDFLADLKEMDYTKREEERKIEREGNYLVRFEEISQKITFSYLLAPKINHLQKEETRALIKLYSLIGDVDLSLSYLHVKKWPKLGINLSGVIGNKIEFHAEVGLSKGSKRKLLREERQVGPGVYEYGTYDDPEDDKMIFTKALIGEHYTFANKTNVIIEYFFNQDGYSEAEWTNFIDLATVAYTKFKQPPAELPADIFKENLRRANSLMRYRYMRKNYLFFRVSNPEIFDDYDGQISLLLNADDKSLVIMPAFDYQKWGRLVIRLGLNWFSGNSKSEFGLVPYQTEFQLGVKYLF
ncbi:MAG: hypothetical protein ABIG09_06970 [bacterium]